MYRILVVEPDKNYREGIVRLLRNSDYEMAVQTVSNGETAIEFAANNCIDLLITDIILEDIDGFSLINEIKTVNENLVFIIISESNEFGDAKKAIKLGAVDYIHKPFEKTEFIEAVSLALSRCEKFKNITEQTEINYEFVKEHVLLSLLYGKKIEEIKIDEEFVENFEEYNKYKRLILIEFSNDFFNKAENDFERQFIEFLEFNNIYCHYINLNSTQSVLLLDEKFCSENSEEKITSVCEIIKNKLSIKYSRKCFLALSSEIDNCNELSKAIDETEELMERKFYENNSKVFVKIKEEESPIFVQSDDDSLVKQIKQDIKLKDIESLKDSFNILWNRYGNKKNLSQIYIKFVFSNILKEFYDALPNVSEVDLNNEVDKLYRTNALADLKEIMDINIARLEEVFNVNPQMVHREVECVKQYIFNNYMNEIGVEQLAEMVYMAPSYLSCVFKKETGQNLSKFIKSVRMEKAKDMLENTHMKIVSISSEVGYPNVSYFCQSFREYFGISPQKFRTNGEK
ncbi:MAG: response regulator [Lachnospiraceae bacterium]|nr:response regulator [Lachnospiraceae bacterium]